MSALTWLFSLADGGGGFFVLAACAGALGAGVCAYVSYAQYRLRRDSSRRAIGALDDATATGGGWLGLHPAKGQEGVDGTTEIWTANADNVEAASRNDLVERLVGFAMQCSRYQALRGRKLGQAEDQRQRGFNMRRARALLDAHGKKAGVDGSITPAGFADARLRLTFGCALAGSLVGTLFSWQLTLLLGASGGFAGWTALPWALKQRQRQRADELERHLPEMLEVITLGLRSGLSFDRSLELFVEHFDSLLARSCRSALRQWTVGLATREEALKRLATGYDSNLFARVIQNVVRSLRFGTSLAESLEQSAVEARAAYRAKKQEQVAKAPVKMMIPTGTLMLPAMLLLVLGPVLLELIRGF